MVHLTKALLGAVLALSVVLTPALSAPSTTSITPTKGGAAVTPAPSGGTNGATTTPTVIYNLPTPSPTSTTPPLTNPAQQLACPAIMIRDNNPNPNATIEGRVCHMGCCVPCPAINSFYEPNKVENVLQAAYFIRQASLGFAVFMAISYLVLPGKRSQPHISVLFLTVSLSLWYAAFDIMPGYSNACANEYDMSTGKNNTLCGIQGVLIIYLTQTSALWCSLLIYKLHLLAVWRSNWIDAHYAYFTGFCWVFPLAFAIPVAVKNLAEYPGIGFSCLVGTENLNTYLFYPVAIYMYPAMICHVVTVGKMIHLAAMSSKIDTGLSQLSTDARMKVTTTMQAKRLLRGQWRPALMVGTVMTSLTIFWLFYFVDTHSFAKTNKDTVWLQQWVGCVFMQAKAGKSADEMQTVCAQGARPNLPNIHWFTAAEVLLALLGVVVAMVFITKAEFWEEWGYLLSNLLHRGKRRNGSSSSSRGSRSPANDGHESNSPTMVNRHPSTHSNSIGEEIARKGGPMARSMNISRGLHNDMNGSSGAPGVFRSNSQSLSTKNLTSGGESNQWYDMDDLLDKEYELQEHQPTSLHHASSSHLHRNVSFSTGVPTSPTHSGPIGMGMGMGMAADPPKYNSGSLTSPTRAYFSPSSSDRDTMSPYTEKPVVPTPVPRTPRLNTTPATTQQQQQQQQQHIYLSSPKMSTSPPQSPTSPSSPSYRSANNNSHPLDSVPIIGIATRGSPAMSATTYTHIPRSPRHQPQNQNQQHTYSQPPTVNNVNDSTDQIMVASRESIGHAPLALQGGVGLGGGPTSPVSRTRSPPPSVPHKNPYRNHQPGYMSPPIQLPPGHTNNNNNNYYRE